MNNLKKCWLNLSMILWYSPESNFWENASLKLQRNSYKTTTELLESLDYGQVVFHDKENKHNFVRTELGYRQIPIISRTKSQTLTVSCLVFQLSLSNPLKPGIKSRMKM